MPIIQGYIQIEECKVQIQNDIQGVKTTPKFEVFTLCIISRRSRFRAGTRCVTFSLLIEFILYCFPIILFLFYHIVFHITFMFVTIRSLSVLFPL